jgi:hypothetical protein
LKELIALKKMMILLALITSTAFVNNVSASFPVPTVKETDHWKLELVKPPDDKNITESEKGKFEMYGLHLLNKGEKAYNVRVEAFRNEDGTNTMLGLAPQMSSKVVNKSQDFKFVNFPVKADSKKLEIVVIWEGEPIKLDNGKMADGRKYKETFLITPAP